MGASRFGATRPDGASGAAREPGGAGGFLLLEPRAPWALGLGELWAHRELVWFLALRDIKLRYKQTVLGAAWAVLQPLLTMVVFSVFFGRLARVGSDGTPYPLFAFSALVPWQLFAFTLSQASNSLVNDQALIRKVYFPRLALPVSSVISGVPDFAVSFVALLVMMSGYGIYPGARAVALPLFAAFGMIAALSVGVWLAALNVRYRDFRYTVPFLVQLWLFASPVAYSSSLVPGRWRLLYGLNPMTVVIDGFRWALLGTPTPSAASALSGAMTAAVLFAGVLYFQHVEKSFADVV